MSQQKKVKLMGGAVLALAVVTLFGIVYAAFTQNLRINGSATTIATNWDIHFSNLGPSEGGNVVGRKTGTAVQLQAPSIDGNGTTIGDFSVSLTSPGDSISYLIQVRNDGDYNAKIGSFGYNGDEYSQLPTPVCSVNGDTTNADAQEVCSHLTYTLKKATGDPLMPAEDITVGSTLPSSTLKNMLLTLTYNDFTTELDNMISVINSYSQQMDTIINDGTMTKEEKDTAINNLKIGVSNDSTVPADRKQSMPNYISAYYRAVNADARAGIKSEWIRSYQSQYAGKLPTADVTISNLGFSINYVQDGNSVKTQ